MGVECASCGQVIPPGQLRCGNCGAVQSGGSFDDYGGLTEVTSEPEPALPPDGNVPTPRPAASGLDAAMMPQAAPPAPLATPVRPPPTPPSSSPPAPAEDDGVREQVVPRGTFASEVPDRTLRGDDREPGAARGAARPPAARVPSVRPAPRPPYLASEILREDLTPSEPGWRLLSLVVQLAPALGALAVLSSGLKRAATWVCVTALAAVFGMSRLELTYNTRALLVALIGGGSLAAVTLWRTALGAGVEGPLLALIITLLPAALLFRAWFRAAYAARVLVAVALVLAATWAAATGKRDLLALEFAWQSWLPALAWYLFGLLCLLSLLAFMGDETTGGCDAWAIGLLVWYGLFACVRFALESTHASLLSANLQTLGLAEPALAAPTAVAMAQLFARLLGGRATRAGAAGPSSA